MTYHGNVSNAVGEELVVQARQVSPAVLYELDVEAGLDRESIVAFDDSDDVFLVLLDLVALGAEVLDNVGRAVEAGGRGDVVQRRVLGERRRAGRSQELLVHSLQRHTGLEMIRWVATSWREREKGVRYGRRRAGAEIGTGRDTTR